MNGIILDYIVTVVQILQEKNCKIVCTLLGGEGGPAAPAHTGGTSHVHPLLSSFINYVQSVKFQGQ